MDHNRPSEKCWKKGVPLVATSTPTVASISCERLTDFTGAVTSYEYWPNGVFGAGQVKSETRANGKKTYYNYSARGELCQIWGDVPYPEERVYNEYGDLAELHTFRGGSGWSSATWPTNTAGSFDKTTWVYHEPSGLLQAKRDNNNQGVDYTYTNGIVR